MAYIHNLGLSILTMFFWNCCIAFRLLIETGGVTMARPRSVKSRDEVCDVLICGYGCAGARRDLDRHVFSHNGDTIPRLFEAGELGSMF